MSVIRKFFSLVALVFVVQSFLSIPSVLSQETEGGEEEKGAAEPESQGKISLKGELRAQRESVKAWADLLTENDYENAQWKKKLGGQPQYYFHHYSGVLSDIFQDKSAHLNFALVGACDGTHDLTISDRFLKNDHWRGVFVEPFEINHRDLVKFMEDSHAIDRAYVLKAAATHRCNDTTIKMKRPTFEEKNKSLPHWLRRQVGSVVPYDKLDRPASGGWIFEHVRCVNGQEIMESWAKYLTSKDDGNRGIYPKKMRPHILKVDVEGHDYEVLMGFLDDSVPTNQLPLLINFEAKSLKNKFPLLKEQLIKRGYAVADYAADGFALLKKENIFLKKTKEGGGGGGKEGGNLRRRKRAKANNLETGPQND